MKGMPSVSRKIQTVRFVRCGGELDADLVAICFDGAEIVIGKLQPLEHIELGLGASCVVCLIVRPAPTLRVMIFSVCQVWNFTTVRPGVFCCEAKLLAQKIEPSGCGGRRPRR